MMTLTADFIPLENFLIAAAACMALGVSEKEILKAAESLPQIKWREELVFEKENLKVYNDTAATSPEAAIAALNRFAGRADNLLLIAVGTDRELEFGSWADCIREKLTPGNLVLLSGSATLKMKKELGWDSFNEFESLEG